MDVFVNKVLFILILFCIFKFDSVLIKVIESGLFSDFYE